MVHKVNRVDRFFVNAEPSQGMSYQGFRMERGFYSLVECEGLSEVIVKEKSGAIFTEDHKDYEELKKALKGANKL